MRKLLGLFVFLSFLGAAAPAQAQTVILNPAVDSGGELVISYEPCVGIYYYHVNGTSDYGAGGDVYEAVISTYDHTTDETWVADVTTPVNIFGNWGADVVYGEIAPNTDNLTISVVILRNGTAIFGSSASVNGDIAIP
jgi:hypothetical protein